MQNTTIFVGVEGSGSLHSLWMPKGEGRSGFLQIQPLRNNPEEAEGKAFGRQYCMTLYTQQHHHYFGTCVQNLALPDMHSTPSAPGLYVSAVRGLYERLRSKTCKTCLLNSTGLCPKPNTFN